MSFKRRAELSRTVRAGPSRAAPWAQGTNVWQFLYSAGLLQTPAILVYIEYVIAVCKCVAIPVFSKIIYKCQQFLYTLSTRSRHTNAWQFRYSARLFTNASNSCIHRVCNCGIQCLVIPVFSPTVCKCRQCLHTLSLQLLYTNAWQFLSSARLFTNASNFGIHWVCNCGSQMPDNLCIQSDCLQMPAIVVDIEYVIAVCKAWQFLYTARLFTNASNSCIHWVCNCGIQMLGNFCIQPDCLQMPAIPVYTEYVIAVYKCLTISVFSPTVCKRQQLL